MSREYKCRDCAGLFETMHDKGVLPIRCAACHRIHRLPIDREKAQRWRKAHPDKVRENSRLQWEQRKVDPEWKRSRREHEARKRYGISPEQFQALQEKQGDKCAICRGEPNGPGTRLHIDHCHDSKRVRGLLCGRCNTMIGLAKENVSVLASAIAYLKED